MFKGNSRAIVGENVREGKRMGLSEKGAVLRSLKNPLPKKLGKSQALGMPTSMGEKYPYGLRLELNHDTLKTLGVKKLHPAGATLHIHAIGTVDRTSQDSSLDGGKTGVRRSMSVQLTKMHLKPVDSD